MLSFCLLVWVVCTSCLDHTLYPPPPIQSTVCKNIETTTATATTGLTSGHLFHEDLYEAVLADGSQVLDDILVLQVFVKSDLLVERLRIPVRVAEQMTVHFQQYNKKNKQTNKQHQKTNKQKKTLWGETFLNELSPNKALMNKNNDLIFLNNDSGCWTNHVILSISK